MQMQGSKIAKTYYLLDIKMYKTRVAILKFLFWVILKLLQITETLKSFSLYEFIYYRYHNPN